VSDGTIRVKTTESNPDAVRRDYELRDGTKGTKFELVYNDLSGLITGISFYEGDFGKTLHITISDGEEKTILSLGIDSNYAEDLMKKIPNIKLDETVTLSPYSFEDDKKKLRKGISVVQNEIKIKSFFYDTDKKETLHGFPKVDKDKTYDKDEWKIYFMTTRKFLEKFITENICQMFLGLSPEQVIDAVGGKVVDTSDVTDDEIASVGPESFD